MLFSVSLSHFPTAPWGQPVVPSTFHAGCYPAIPERCVAAARRTLAGISPCRKSMDCLGNGGGLSDWDRSFADDTVTIKPTLALQE